MEEDQAAFNNGGEEAENFYEMIEAPKFVDFTVPDHYCPDDRYWFCLRVGCDQKHEEEMDWEAIFKSFVLRVMAARSPNVRLRKIPSANKKCPLTVPAKSSKSRVSRLALVSSFSKKVVDSKLKTRNFNKPTATPKVKDKESSAVSKALTTPKIRKRISNAHEFQSVQNPKSKSKPIAVAVNRSVAKALVFQSPKKAVKAKEASVEKNTALRTLTQAIKKLEINNGKRHGMNSEKTPALDASRRKLRGREVKSRVFDPSNSHNCKKLTEKSARKLKRKNEEGDLKECESSDMEIDEKLVDGSLPTSSKSGEGSESESLPNALEISDGNAVDLSRGSGGESASIISLEEKDSRLQAQNEPVDERLKPSSEKGKIPKESIRRDDKENAVDTDDKENNGEVIDNEEKENDWASDGNREHNCEKCVSETVAKLGQQKTSKNVTKVKGAFNKSLKEKSKSAVKYPKPKPTNPRPFRLRTDERGILKEANLDRRLHAPSKEDDSISKIQEGKLEQKVQNMIQEKTQSNSTPMKKTPCKHRKSNLTSQTEESKNDKETVKSCGSLKRNNKLQRIQQKCTRNAASTRKVEEVVCSRAPAQLCVIQETSTILRQKEAAKSLRSCCISPAITKASLCPTSRSSSRGRRRPATIPKEPNFHRIHVPKDCTRKLA